MTKILRAWVLMHQGLPNEKIYIADIFTTSSRRAVACSDACFKHAFDVGSCAGCLWRNQPFAQAIAYCKQVPSKINLMSCVIFLLGVFFLFQCYVGAGSLEHVGRRLWTVAWAANQVWILVFITDCFCVHVRSGMGCSFVAAGDTPKPSFVPWFISCETQPMRIDHI